MRTTLSIDDDMYQLASSYAAARKTTLGVAISELIRAATTPQTSRTGFTMGPHGLPVLNSRGRTITTEMVKAAQDDEIG